MVASDYFICFKCIHFNPISGGCAAFPEGIPFEITDNGNSHFDPLPDQNNDIVFELGMSPEHAMFDENDGYTV